MLKKFLSTTALAALVVLGGAAAASASGLPELTADPSSVEVGEETTITATALGGLETASFGLDGTPGGTLIDPSTGEQITQYDAPVDNGEATVRFSATEAGTFTVAVGTGETIGATVQVTVTSAASPEPEPTPTVTVTVEPEPEPSMTTTSGTGADTGIPLWAIILIVVLAVVVVGAIIAIVVLVARRGKAGGTGA
jgi:cobalamin biosynthesis Mg chelatase CobN